MQKNDTAKFEERTFRANPDFELLLFDRLSPQDKLLLQEMREDPQFYGILRPSNGTGLGIKTVCREMALLFLTLQAPGQLPGYVRTQFGDGWQEDVIEMVLDGILQIESDGQFVCGADAHDIFFNVAQKDAAANAISQLSIDAIRYAQALDLDDVQVLSQRLYSYNRMPLTPAWKRLFAAPGAVAKNLGIQSGGVNYEFLERYWIRVSGSNNGWLAWQPRRDQTVTQKSKSTYKLYLSPHPAHLSEALAVFLKQSAVLNALAFKVGKDAYGLLRPDKMVVYFSNFQDLAEGAEQLRYDLDGCPAQGVPFTAAITSDGLLSWGMDPPRPAQTPLPSMRESWRLWITNRLARALLAAQSSLSTAVEPWQFALNRLRLEGIDTATWKPSKKIWKKYTTAKE